MIKSNPIYEVLRTWYVKRCRARGGPAQQGGKCIVIGFRRCRLWSWLCYLLAMLNPFTTLDLPERSLEVRFWENWESITLSLFSLPFCATRYTGKQLCSSFRFQLLGAWLWASVHHPHYRQCGSLKTHLPCWGKWVFPFPQVAVNISKILPFKEQFSSA